MSKPAPLRRTKQPQPPNSINGGIPPASASTVPSAAMAVDDTVDSSSALKIAIKQAELDHARVIADLKAGKKQPTLPPPSVESRLAQLATGMDVVHDKIEHISDKVEHMFQLIEAIVKGDHFPSEEEEEASDSESDSEMSAPKKKKAKFSEMDLS